MKKIIYLFTLIAFVCCKPKEKLMKSNSCKSDYIQQYDRESYNRNTNPKIPKDSNSITVIFLSEYKDSVRAYIDEKLVFDKFVDQRDWEDSDRYSFGKLYLKNSESPVVKIEMQNQKSCFDFKVDKRYSFVYVWRLENKKWQIRFSNSYYIP